MKTRIIQIGNSQGIRIPKALLDQSGLGKEVELKVNKEQIIIRPAKKVREGWPAAFKMMASQRDDRLLDQDTINNQSSWDETEWAW